MTEQNTVYNPLQTVKRRLFAMRNGIISDVLRKAGSPFRIIFGLNLPQIVEIATEIGKDHELARQLWANTTTRESMLIAPMLVPVEEFTIDEARSWAAGIPAAEVADIFCHRLLRHCSFAPQLASELIHSEKEMDRYTAIRLMFNLVSKYPDQAAEIATIAANHPSPLTDSVSVMLADEVAFIKESSSN